ncbi:innexin unc-9-like [Saccostrea cucullata]|uniref:innexin unc-9-like n=1 Tax=Saccostrea cuccullata TaxID=36930 RepID=UPI002ED02682
MPLVVSLEKILGPAGVYKRPFYDDNYIDRMTYYYTNMFLLFYVMLSVTEEWFQFPVKCFCPVNFSPEEVRYTNHLCWVEKMYFVPWNRTIPSDYDIRQLEMQIQYYQYVPVTCLMMAFLFYLPRLVWKQCTNSSGLKLKKLIEMARSYQLDDDNTLMENELKFQYGLIDIDPYGDERRKDVVRTLTEYIDLYCAKSQPYRAGALPSLRERFGSLCYLGIGRHYGNFFPALQIGVRALYFLTAFGHLWFLNAFIGNEFAFYGYEVVMRFLRGEENYIGTSRFPIVTLCDLEIRRMFTFYRYTIQCVIPINIFNEKFFLFLWCWLVVLSLLSFLNLFISIGKFVTHFTNISFLKKYLAINEIYFRGEKSMKIPIRRFYNHLKQDGVFILRLLAQTTNTVVVTEVMRELWAKFRERELEENDPNFENNNIKKYPPTNGVVRFNNTVIHVNGNGSLSYCSERDLVTRFRKETFV